MALRTTVILLTNLREDIRRSLRWDSARILATITDARLMPWCLLVLIHRILVLLICLRRRYTTPLLAHSRI
jgi:hypothetical protein